MESALYGVYTLVVLYQKSHSFASLTCSISDAPQLVCKHRTRTFHEVFYIYGNLAATASFFLQEYFIEPFQFKKN